MNRIQQLSIGIASGKFTPPPEEPLRARPTLARKARPLGAGAKSPRASAARPARPLAGDSKA
jgi:hypothetical protein